jgi:SNF2 family DNA or RNA helicase
VGAEAVKLRDWLERHGPAIGELIEKKLTPVYNPLKPEGVEEYARRLPALLKTPYSVQAEVIKGSAKALFKAGRKRIFVVGEMGTGKTLLSLATQYMFDTPARVLVVCPTTLVNKWIREAKETIPDVQAIDLTVPHVITILQQFRQFRGRPQVHEIYVMSKEKAKLSYPWRPAALMKSNAYGAFCPQCAALATENDEYLTMEDLHKKRRACGECGGPLWQADRSLRRFAPAEYIKKYLKGFWDLVIIDEIQAYKAEGTLQGRAMGSLLTAIPYTACLTGTLNGGYADDLFNLLFRMDPKQLKSDGFDYGASNKFLAAYGTIEQVREIEEEDVRRGRGRKKGDIVRRRPGVSPVAIGKYLLDKSVFIRLADVIDGLPPYEEIVLNYTMTGPQLTEYGMLQTRLKDAVRKYKSKALGAMLQALLSYPDSCVAFSEEIGITDRKAGQVLDVIDAPKVELGDGELLTKEEDLVKIAKKEKKEGRKLLCYVVFSGLRDIRPRIKEVLDTHRIRTGVLDRSVAPKRREEWLKKHSCEFDVLIANVELVKEGLDLYDFPSIYFYQTGHNIFTLRQGARRSWRIGQKRSVRVYFGVYRDTMQDVALALTAKKLEAALLVEGELPEGLADYSSDEGSIMQELGKALLEGTANTAAEKAWARFRKKEIEAQLGIGGKERVFTIPDSTKACGLTSVTGNVTVKVTFLDGKRRNKSVVEVAYGDLDKVAAGRPVQFTLF